MRTVDCKKESDDKNSKSTCFNGFCFAEPVFFVDAFIFFFSKYFFFKCVQRLLSAVAVNEEKCNNAICLFVFFRYLATGESLRSLAFQFRIHHTWVSRIVHSTLAAIVTNLTAIAMSRPTEECWRRNANDFELKWSYPNCIGAIDGKHIRVRCPSNTGSLCYNYKDFFSIVLLAIVDANYKIVAIDIGAYGREGDAGVFMRSNMGQKINNHTFDIPPPKASPGTEVELPHVIVGDEAFALHENLMKSYPRQATLTDRTKLVYNFRHSHARRVSENAFGILCSLFRIFFTPINCSIDHINNIVMASCILHNLLRDESSVFHGEENEMPTQNFRPLAPNTRRYSEARYAIRDAFKDYFNGVGATEWQNAHINSNF